MPHHVITGATQGIGRALVARLAFEGHALTVVGRNASALEALVADGLAARAVIADLSRPQDAADAVAAAVGEAPIDGLAHVAGVCYQDAIADADAAAWSAQLEVNVVAPAVLTSALLPGLRAARGTVVFLNSMSGRRVAAPTWAPYAASKHALKAVADGLRLEEPLLRVASVYPGRVATPMQEAVRAREGVAYDPTEFLAAEAVSDIVADLLTADPARDVRDVTVMPRAL